jgi:hypothetical protein
MTLVKSAPKKMFSQKTILPIENFPEVLKNLFLGKSPHKTFGYFLSTSQREVSAYNVQNSAVGNFSPKKEGNKDKSS